MEDKIILKFKTKNILNFYEIEPWSLLAPVTYGELAFVVAAPTCPTLWNAIPIHIHNSPTDA